MGEILGGAFGIGVVKSDFGENQVILKIWRLNWQFWSFEMDVPKDCKGINDEIGVIGIVPNDFFKPKASKFTFDLNGIVVNKFGQRLHSFARVDKKVESSSVEVDAVFVANESHAKLFLVELSGFAWFGSGYSYGITDKKWHLVFCVLGRNLGKTRFRNSSCQENTFV